MSAPEGAVAGAANEATLREVAFAELVALGARRSQSWRKVVQDRPRATK